jgi:hypothetical protein
VLIGNDAVVAFAATVTDPGTVSPGRPVLVKLTTAPPDPAAFDSATVQVPLALAPNVVGLHCSEDMTAGAVKLTVEESDVPLYAAVMIAFWSVVTPGLVAAKVPIVELAGTVIDGGTVSLVLLLDSDIVSPPAGAAASRVTVQVDDPVPCSEVGVQVSDSTWYVIELETVTIPPVPDVV